jgi:uncharacterized protein YcfJ
MKALIQILVLLLFTQFSVQSHAECQESSGGGEILGTLAGAAIGGLVGSQFGGGTGNKIAIGAGGLSVASSVTR